MNQTTGLSKFVLSAQCWMIFQGITLQLEMLHIELWVCLHAKRMFYRFPNKRNQVLLYPGTYKVKATVSILISQCNDQGLFLAVGTY